MVPCGAVTTRSAESTFSLETPPSPEAPGISRIWMTAVALGCRIDPDVAADLGVAHEQLCAVVVAHAPDGLIRTRCRFDGETFRMEIGPWPPAIDDLADVDPWDLVHSLFDTAHVRDEVAVLTTRTDAT